MIFGKKKVLLQQKEALFSPVTIYMLTVEQIKQQFNNCGNSFHTTFQGTVDNEKQIEQMR